MSDTIIVFGTGWCGDCLRVRRYFDQNQITYQWIDIDQDERGEEFVLANNAGMRSVPTIVFRDGSIIVEPTVTELKNKLQSMLESS